MKFRHMEVLSAIVKSGSVSGAARLLHVSQPNVTRVLNHAEQQLGFVLFKRRRKGLVPTPEACLLLPEVEAVMKQMEVLEDCALQIRRGGGQRLRIGSVPALAQSIMPDILIRVNEEYPGLIIELATLHFDTACEKLINNQLDLAIVFTHQAPSWSNMEIVYNGRLVAVSPKSMKISKRKVALSFLTQNKMILIPANDPLGEILNKALVNSNLPICSDYQIKTYSVLVDLVAAGAGVAAVDPFTASRYKDRVNIASIEPELTFSVALLHHIDAPLSSAGLFMLELLRSTVESKLQ